MSAAGAPIAMTTQRRRAATDDWRPSPLRCWEARCDPCRSRKLLPQARRMSATSRVGRVIPSHASLNASPRLTSRQQRLQGAGDSLQVPARQMQIDRRISQLGVTEQELMVRRSAPASSRCVAKLCRSVCGETRLVMPAAFAASVTAVHATFV